MITHHDFKLLWLSLRNHPGVEVAFMLHVVGAAISAKRMYFPDSVLLSALYGAVWMSVFWIPVLATAWLRRRQYEEKPKHPLLTPQVVIAEAVRQFETAELPFMKTMAEMMSSGGGGDATMIKFTRRAGAPYSDGGLPIMKSTHTYATLDVPKALYTMIREKLVIAGYMRADAPVDEPLDMKGLALVADAAAVKEEYKCNLGQLTSQNLFMELRFAYDNTPNANGAIHIMDMLEEKFGRYGGKWRITSNGPRAGEDSSKAHMVVEVML